MKLDGKVALIAGGSGALGQKVALAFAQAGARVITVDRDTPSVQAKGRLAIKADVTNEAEVQTLVSNVVREAGRIDVLINLVGGFATGRVAETDAALWQRMLAMNLTAGFVLSKAVLPHMLERRVGRILHVAARAAVEPFPGAAAYIVSKSGLVALIRALSLEVAGTGVTTNGVLPSTMDTPANRASMPDADPTKWVKPESVAKLLIFLSCDDADQINGALIPM